MLMETEANLCEARPFPPLASPKLRVPDGFSGQGPLVGFLVAQTVKNLPAVQEAWVPSLGREDPLEEGIATHSSVLAWRIPWTKEPGGYSPWGLEELGTTERLSAAEARPQLALMGAGRAAERLVAGGAPPAALTSPCLSRALNAEARGWCRSSQSSLAPGASSGTELSSRTRGLREENNLPWPLCSSGARGRRVWEGCAGPRTFERRATRI